MSLARIFNGRKRIDHVTVYQSADRWHWVKVRADGPNLSSSESWIDPTDAIDTAVAIAASEGVKCHIDRDLYDAYTREQWLAGVDLYRNDVPAEYCANRWQAAGWADAYADDSQPLPLHGWPLAEAVPA